MLVAQMLDRVRAIPGVRSATPASFTPLGGSVWNRNVVVDGAVAKYTDLREPFGPIAYRPMMQDSDPGAFLQIVASSDAPLPGIANAVTRVVTDVNPNVLLHYQTLDRQVRDTLVSERLMATLSGFFGALAALIAAIGLYGVLS